jgi:putative SOS response-associated peptidase YedK
MPVILPPEAYDRWLDPNQKEPAELASLLASYPAELISVRPVNPIVNSPANDDPACIGPPPQQTLF